MSIEDLEVAIFRFVSIAEENCDEEWFKEMDKAGVELTNAVHELKQYKDKEEQGLLISIPCKVGDTVYVIPSLTNYRLNVLSGFRHLNKVHEQKVHSIELFGDNRYVVVTCEGMCSVVSDLYEENWFLTEAEAEEALAKMGGK